MLRDRWITDTSLANQGTWYWIPLAQEPKVVGVFRRQYDQVCLGIAWAKTSGTFAFELVISALLPQLCRSQNRSPRVDRNSHGGEHIMPWHLRDIWPFNLVKQEEGRTELRSAQV